MNPTPYPNATALFGGLAERIARRDQPALAVPDPYATEQVMHRLLTALAPLVPGRNQRGRIVQARMLYRFFAHEALTARNLADAANVERVAGGRATAGLVHAGLLQWTYEGPRRVYRLTRWGEDWLLAIGRCEVPPVRPVG
jgi:predicted transcriptional regulator